MIGHVISAEYKGKSVQEGVRDSEKVSLWMKFRSWWGEKIVL